MTDRLYYHNSFLYDFVAALEEVRTLADGRTALVLDRTAFYPTSGGQVFDTGWLELEPLEAERGKFLPKLRVSEVAEEEDGTVLHIVDGEKKPTLSLREKDGAPSSIAIGARSTLKAIDALAWRMAERLKENAVTVGDHLDVAFTIDRNTHPEYGGGLQLKVCDFALAAAVAAK